MSLKVTKTKVSKSKAVPVTHAPIEVAAKVAAAKVAAVKVAAVKVVAAKAEAEAVKVEAVKVEAVKVEAVKADAVKADAVPNAEDSSPLFLRLKLMQDGVNAISAQLNQFKKNLTAISKDYAKERKQAQRLQNKKKPKAVGGGVKHQSGIAKPGFISPALCDFIGVGAGTEMARTEVIKYINKYIKDHQLQDQANKKVILPDTKLQVLLQSKTNDMITFFNLQTYMKPHYANPLKQLAA
jgi:chromatin remodeling complex protein RSC6